MIYNICRIVELRKKALQMKREGREDEVSSSAVT